MVQVCVYAVTFCDFWLLFFIFYCKTDKTHYSVKKCVFFFSFSGFIGDFSFWHGSSKKNVSFSVKFSEKSARCHHRLKEAVRTRPYGEFWPGDAAISSITLSKLRELRHLSNMTRVHFNPVLPYIYPIGFIKYKDCNASIQVSNQYFKIIFLSST